MSNIQELVTSFALDYENPYKMFEVAKEYDRLEQNAGAFTFYLRAAEFCKGETYEEKLLQYKALILGAHCYADEKNRHVTVYSLLKNAVVVMPDRPEAYYFLCYYAEQNEHWRDCLVWAAIGKQYIGMEPLDDIDYPGDDGLLYHYAASSWKDNGNNESKRLFFDLIYKHDVHHAFKDKAFGWLNNIGYPSYVPYLEEEINEYKFPFPGIENVKKNYARHYQDMFVLSVLDGKRNGTFVELGSGLPYKANNTALLEDEFNWKGISIDNSERFCNIFSKERRSTVIKMDAAQIGYAELFEKHNLEDWVDFLRINAEHASIEALKRIPFGRQQYGVIQFQHNACWWGGEFREQSREILNRIGYVLMVNDVSMDPNSNYEDWWVHPQIAREKQHMLSRKEKNFIFDYVTKGR